LPASSQDRKKLVICGISAGFAAVFGTPIAGSIFGVEVLFVAAFYNGRDRGRDSPETQNPGQRNLGDGANGQKKLKNKPRDDSNEQTR
jgi:hypothetical protein